jgi:hypothetical protein
MPQIVTVNAFSPQQGIRRPSALERLVPEGGIEDLQGIMEKAEPVSTR